MAPVYSLRVNDLTGALTFQVLLSCFKLDKPKNTEQQTGKFHNYQLSNLTIHRENIITFKANRSWFSFSLLISGNLALRCLHFSKAWAQVRTSHRTNPQAQSPFVLLTIAVAQAAGSEKHLFRVYGCGQLGGGGDSAETIKANAVTLSLFLLYPFLLRFAILTPDLPCYDHMSMSCLFFPVDAF